MNENNGQYMAELGQNRRAVVNNWNLLGKKLVCVKSKVIDLRHSDKVAANNPRRLVKPFIQYYLEYCDVISCRLATLPGGRQVVIINEGKNDENTFPIASEKQPFPRVTIDDVVEGIKLWEANKEDKKAIRWYDDLESVTKIVETINAEEKAQIEALVEEAMEWAELLRKLNGLHKTTLESYMQELGNG